MKQYLIDTFNFNDTMNKLVLEKMKEMPEPAEAVKLFSHLINSQNKWMARINEDPKAPDMFWFEPVYELNALETNWNKSLSAWLNFLGKISDEDMNREIHFIGDNRGHFGAKIKDVALQLNYHSIHHRAQICTLLRKQNIKPPFVEYFGTVRKQY
ncbi:MAG: DinB family protein [Ignavibacteria bacterium]